MAPHDAAPPPPAPAPAPALVSNLLVNCEDGLRLVGDNLFVGRDNVVLVDWLWLWFLLFFFRLMIECFWNILDDSY